MEFYKIDPKVEEAWLQEVFKQLRIPSYKYKLHALPTKQWYNPETHELVEKKEAKIKRLKDEINKEEQRVQTCKTVIDSYATNIKEAEDNIKKLNKELKELE